MNDLIEKLSNLRSQFNCFNENERDAYHTLSEAIKVLSERPEPCEDAVSRKDILRWIKTECNPYGKPSLDYESGVRVMEHIKKMLSVTPERKKGKWSLNVGKFKGYIA